MGSTPHSKGSALTGVRFLGPRMEVKMMKSPAKPADRRKRIPIAAYSIISGIPGSITIVWKAGLYSNRKDLSTAPLPSATGRLNKRRGAAWPIRRLNYRVIQIVIFGDFGEKISKGGDEFHAQAGAHFRIIGKNMT